MTTAGARTQIRVQLDDLDDLDDLDLDDLDLDDLDLDDLDDLDLDEQYRAAVAKPDPDRMAWTPGPEHGLPSAIAVGGKPYDVRVFDPRDDKWWGNLLGGLGDATLWVRRDCDAEERRETLLHEVLHGVDHAAGTAAGETVVNAGRPSC